MFLQPSLSQWAGSAHFASNGCLPPSTPEPRSYKRLHRQFRVSARSKPGNASKPLRARRSPRRLDNQKSSFRANWICRAAFCVASTCPKFGFLVKDPELGFARFTVLKALKNSVRNWSVIVSPGSAKFLKRMISQFARAGPLSVFRPKLPNLYCSGTEKASGLSHPRVLSAELRTRAGLSSTRSGRWNEPKPIFARSKSIVTLTGAPVLYLVIPLTAQPPNTLLKKGEASGKKRFPLPKGSSYR